MKEADRGGEWTVLLFRSGRTRGASWQLRGRTLGVLAAVATVIVAGIGVTVGLWWEGRQESARVAELKEELHALEAEREQVMALAARMDSVEAYYRRIREVMGDGPVEGGVELPPLPSRAEETRDPAAVRGDDGEPYLWPLAQAGFVSRRHQAEEGGRGHRGLDIAVPTGSYVRATRAGTVEEAGEDSVFGLYLRIRHEDGVTSLYGHNQWLFVAPGDSVEAAEVVALSGSSGRSTAPHLHFELSRQGRALDPARVLRRGLGMEVSSRRRRSR